MEPDTDLALPRDCPVCGARRIEVIREFGDPDGKPPMILLRQDATYKCRGELSHQWVQGGGDGTEIYVITPCEKPMFAAMKELADAARGKDG